MTKDLDTIVETNNTAVLRSLRNLTIVTAGYACATRKTESATPLKGSEAKATILERIQQSLQGGSEEAFNAAVRDASQEYSGDTTAANYLGILLLHHIQTRTQTETQPSEQASATQYRKTIAEGILALRTSAKAGQDFYWKNQALLFQP